MFKVDLHTHSVASPDGSISRNQYKKVFASGLLDCVAITDHNRIDFALELQQELGERIIVGEEIMTTAGEIIGLFLEHEVLPGLNPAETIKRIKDQGGIVYIPHPFETIRKGLHPAVLEEVADSIDLIEICNGRAYLQNRSEQTVVWARLNHVPGLAASDAHGIRGLGKTFTLLKAIPTQETLVELCTSGTPRTERPGIATLLYPKYNRLRSKIRRLA